MYIDEKSGSSVSLLDLEGYSKFSDIFKKIRPGDKWNHELHRFDNDGGPLPDLQSHLKILLNKNPEELKEETKQLEEDYEKYGAFLLKEDITVGRLIFASFPRSGNSMYRKYFQETSFLLTGYD